MMFNQRLQPGSEQVAQRLRLIDVRLEQLYPGYLTALQQLRQPRTCYQDGEWNKFMEQRHIWKGQGKEQ